MSNMVQVSQKDLIPLMEEVLKEGKKVRFTVSGNSMWPWLIHQRDSVLLEGLENKRLKKGDIILFQAYENHYVLHRITRKVRGGYITTGDGNLTRDGFVPEDKVIGKAVVLYRKNTEILCGQWKWRIVAWFWMAGFPIRKHLAKLIAFWKK